MAKQTKAKPISEQQFDEALKTHADAERQKAIVSAKLEAAVAKASEKFNKELKDLATTSDNARTIVEQYCTENKTMFEGAERSLKTAHGVVGFRTTAYAVRIPDGTKTEDIIALLKKKKLTVYLVTKDELAKKKMVENRSDKKLVSALAEMNIEIKQGETFFIDLK